MQLLLTTKAADNFCCHVLYAKKENWDKAKLTNKTKTKLTKYLQRLACVLLLLSAQGIIWKPD